MKYYSIPNRFTQIENENWIIPQLKYDLDLLFECVKSILIHPYDTKIEKVKFDRSKNKLFHAQNTTVDKILTYPGLSHSLKNQVIPLNTNPQDKAVLSCDHHALLFASFVRNIGINIRVKTGYAKYLVEGALIPHWITEIFDETCGEWTLIDPERKIKNVSRDDFVEAHEAWLQYFETDKKGFPSYSGLTGLQGLKYAVFCELNCVFKNELLGYEWRVKSFNKKKPEIVHRSFERLTEQQQDDVHRMAKLLRSPDENIEGLYNLYKKYEIDPETEFAVL